MSECADILDVDLSNIGMRSACKLALADDGAVVLDNFLKPATLESLVVEARRLEPNAFFAESTHSVYLTPSDPNYPEDHPQNRQVISTKGCVCDDDISRQSALRTIYNDPGFKDFLCDVLGEEGLHPYADPLSSINIHYAPAGKELGWHFDNSEFAVTLLLQAPDAGGVFEYVQDFRDAAAGDMNYEGVARLLDGEQSVSELKFQPGALVLFRGRNSIHRVTPTVGDTTRYLVVLAFNGEPEVSLSENARMTFYGRVS